jgi:NTE family protein
MGVLRRLDELGILSNVDVVSTVSGGSIVGAYYVRQMGLGTGVAEIEASFTQALKANVRLRGLTGGMFFHPISFLRSLLPGHTRTNTTAIELDRLLFHGATLLDLPDHPKLIVNATSLNTGQVWKFSKDEMYDYRHGTVLKPEVPLCDVVGASAAVPGLFPPLILDPDYLRDIEPPPPTDSAEKLDPASVKRLALSDGGVRDNQGVRSLLTERVPYLIVSDASGLIDLDPSPSAFAGSVLLRSNSITMDAARDLTVQKIFERKDLENLRQIVFFDMEDKATDAPGLPMKLRKLAANVRTDLDWFSDEEIETIKYHGYTLLDQKTQKYATDLLGDNPPALTWQIDYTPEKAASIQSAMSSSHKRRMRPHKF